MSAGVACSVQVSRTLSAGPSAPCRERALWESDDALWVMGDQMSDFLRQVKGSMAQSSAAAPLLEETLPAAPGACPELSVSEVLQLNRRGRCSFKAKSYCPCKKYTPVLMLSTDLFDRLEISADLEKKANEILWSESGESLSDRSDLQMECEDTYKTRPGVHDMLGHVARYAVKPAKRVAVLRGQSPVDRASLSSVLDGLEHAANMTLLPDLLRWCEEFRAAKISVRNQATQREAAYSACTRPRTASSAEAAEDSEGNSSPARKPAWPRLVCQCGHADTWHERAVLVGGDGSSLHSQDMTLEPFDVTSPLAHSASGSGVQSPLLSPTGKRASTSDIVLSGGKLASTGAHVVGCKYVAR